MKNNSKTLSDFFKNYSSNEKFARKVWKMGGVDFNESKERPYDFYDASSGSIPGCIYYSDTVKFAKKNTDVIHEQIRDFEEETGSMLNKMPRFSENETGYYNFLTWFAWEKLAGELINYLEN